MLFLIMNIPFVVSMFCLILEELVEGRSYMYPGPIFKHWHVFPISKVVCVALNAATNPLLYFLRIPKFKGWIKRLGRGIQIKSKTRR